MSQSSIRTRFAPSPTGFLHIGGARTALYSWLTARHAGGATVLRVEDTDLERSTPEAVDAIIDGLQWLGLDFDEGPFFQTQRFDRYKAVIQDMLQAGTAYYCYCSREELEQMREAALAAKQKPRYAGIWRPESGKTLPTIPPLVQPVVRFKNPATGVTVFDDLIHGTITFSNEELDDLIIARPDGTPTYNFCVVVDDMDMGITHVVRGDDHINNTPRQINILKALGASIPTYAHVAMILGDDGQKLSKRHGAVSVTQYRDQGYVPDAVINYLVRLGWSYGDQELFSRQELVDLFDISRVNKSASAFNTSKLNWLNQQYMVAASPETLANWLLPYLAQQGITPTISPALAEVAQAHVARTSNLVELAQMIAYAYQDEIAYDADAEKTHLTAESITILSALCSRLTVLSDWQCDTLNAAIKACVSELGIKMPHLGLPLRTAICGRAASPNLDITLYLVGREKTLARLQKVMRRFV